MMIEFNEEIEAQEEIAAFEIDMMIRIYQAREPNETWTRFSGITMDDAQGGWISIAHDAARKRILFVRKSDGRLHDQCVAVPPDTFRTPPVFVPDKHLDLHGARREQHSRSSHEISNKMLMIYLAIAAALGITSGVVLKQKLRERGQNEKQQQEQTLPSPRDGR